MAKGPSPEYRSQHISDKLCEKEKRVFGIREGACGKEPTPTTCRRCPFYVGPTIPKDNETLTTGQNHNIVTQVLVYGIPTGD